MRDAPAYRLLPPLAFGLPFVAGVVLSWIVPLPLPLGAARGPLSLVLLLGAIALGASAFHAMSRARTPWAPGQATQRIVARGPFAFTRNPLYATMGLAYLGLAVAWPSAWALLLAPVAFALVTWGAIVPEERYLEAKFGDEYDAYRRRVRRWL